MKTKILKYCLVITATLLILGSFTQCNNKTERVPGENDYKIILLHHSTGNNVWKGNDGFLQRMNRKFGGEFAVPKWFDEYNKTHGTDYFIQEQTFPKSEPYGWQNYPYDYYNIWVKNAGNNPYKEEPTLEFLSQEYDFIIFKHCFPVSDIIEDIGEPDINSAEKRTENYKLQYMALRNKMLEFPDTKFMVWTGAAQVKNKTNPDNAKRARDFFNWVKYEWDQPNDNIYLWDFFELETEGGLYLKDENARNANDSHLNNGFAEKVAPLFCQRIVDIIETNGKKTTLTGSAL
ncbi:MAG: hypothetical protein R2764_17925 [Bacteroidales bacterium]